MTDQIVNEERTIVREIKAYIGDDEYQKTHNSNIYFDVLSIIAAISTFFGLILLASQPISVGLLVFVIIIQGFLIQIMGLLSHDIFVHRRLGKDSYIAWATSMLLTMVRFSVPTGYREAHLSHHRHMGKPGDPEIYKQHLNSSWRRLFFSTFIGVKFAQKGLFDKKPQPYLEVSSKNQEIVRRAKIERWVLRLVVIGLVPVTVIFPKAVIYGYLIPAVMVTPVAGTLRILLEHAEVNPNNPYHTSTYYRTGWISQIAFLWDSGDCHLIHHFFPAIPFYRMRKAVNLMRPFLLDKEVVERQSVLALLYGWFIKNYAHRSLWPDII